MRWLLPGLVYATALPAAAQDPLVADRPDFTESPATVAPGRVQLEAGYTFMRRGEAAAHALGEALVRLPLSSRLEARLALNSYVWTSEPPGRDRGLEDTSLGVKVGVSGASPGAAGPRPEVALLASISLPTGADAYTTPGGRPESKLALAWTLSESVGLSSNVGYAYAREEDARFHEGSGSLSLAFALTQRAGSYLEVFGFARSGEGHEDDAFVDGGLTYLLSDDAQVDIRAGTRLGADERDYFVGVGIARRW